jgi:hypothetical protein
MASGEPAQGQTIASNSFSRNIDFCTGGPSTCSSLRRHERQCRELDSANVLLDRFSLSYLSQVIPRLLNSYARPIPSLEDCHAKEETSLFS